MITTPFVLEQWLTSDRQVSFLRLVDADINWKEYPLPEIRKWFNAHIDEILPYKVEVANAMSISMDPIFNWVRSQTTGLWTLYKPGGWTDTITFAFQSEEDAVLFRLTWS